MKFTRSTMCLDDDAYNHAMQLLVALAENVMS